MKLLNHTRVLLLSSLVTGLLFVYLLQWLMGMHASYQEGAVVRERVARIHRAEEVLRQQQLEWKQLQVQTGRMRTRKKGVAGSIAFVSYLEALCRDHSVRLVSLPQQSTERIEGYEVVLESFSLQGNLTSILKVLYELEYLDRIGTLVHADFQREDIRRGGTRQAYLLAHVHLKRLRNSVEK